MILKCLSAIFMLFISMVSMAQSFYIPDGDINKIREKALVELSAVTENDVLGRATGFYVRVEEKGDFIVTVNHFFEDFHNREGVDIKIENRNAYGILFEVIKCSNENDLDICLLKPSDKLFVMSETLGYFPLNERNVHKNMLSSVGVCKNKKKTFTQTDIEFNKYVHGPVRFFESKNLNIDKSGDVLANKNTKVIFHSRGKRVCGGRSGSPIFDSRGELFGMISESFEIDGEKDYNIAIPRDVIFEYIEEHTRDLKRDKPSFKEFEGLERKKN